MLLYTAGFCYQPFSGIFRTIVFSWPTKAAAWVQWWTFKTKKGALKLKNIRKKHLSERVSTDGCSPEHTVDCCQQKYSRRVWNPRSHLVILNKRRLASMNSTQFSTTAVTRHAALHCKQKLNNALLSMRKKKWSNMISFINACIFHNPCYFLTTTSPCLTVIVLHVRCILYKLTDQVNPNSITDHITSSWTISF